MPRSLVALGANLGDPRRSLARAVELLGAERQIASVRCSRWHETTPIGGEPGQPPFLNAVACLDTTLSASQLHAVLQVIERALGRQRGQRWAARSLDLDLLLYDDQVIDTPALVVPHPRMAFRRFVLEPAAEVAQDMVHPTIGWTVRQLLDHLNTAPNYVALLGPPTSGKWALAQLLTGRLGGRYVADPAAELPVSAAVDPSGQAYRRQIQFLDCRQRVLDRQRWPNDDTLAVSDFYLDQCLAYARLELDSDFEAGRETLQAGGQPPFSPDTCQNPDSLRPFSDRPLFDDFVETWRQASPRVVAPKLLVVLDRPVAADSTDRWARDPRAWDRLRNEFTRLASRRGIGPVLRIGELDRQAQFDEISAAILAMQPSGA